MVMAVMVMMPHASNHRTLYSPNCGANRTTNSHSDCCPRQRSGASVATVMVMAMVMVMVIHFIQGSAHHSTLREAVRACWIHRGRIDWRWRGVNCGCLVHRRVHWRWSDVGRCHQNRLLDVEGRLGNNVAGRRVVAGRRHVAGRWVVRHF